MPLPLFDNVLVDARLPEPVRPPRNREREEFERDRFATAGPVDDAPFELNGYYRDKSWRPATIARYGTVEYRAFWSAFAKGKDGQSAPGAEHDEQINRYLRDGYRLGQLVRPLPCMKENR